MKKMIYLGTHFIDRRESDLNGSVIMGIHTGHINQGSPKRGRVYMVSDRGAFRVWAGTTKGY